MTQCRHGNEGECKKCLRHAKTMEESGVDTRVLITRDQELAALQTAVHELRGELTRLQEIERAARDLFVFTVTEGCTTGDPAFEARMNQLVEEKFQALRDVLNLKEG